MDHWGPLENLHNPCRRISANPIISFSASSCFLQERRGKRGDNANGGEGPQPFFSRSFRCIFRETHQGFPARILDSCDMYATNVCVYNKHAASIYVYQLLCDFCAFMSLPKVQIPHGSQGFSKVAQMAKIAITKNKQQDSQISTSIDGLSFEWAESHSHTYPQCLVPYYVRILLSMVTLINVATT